MYSRDEHFVIATQKCEAHAKFSALAEKYGYSPDVKLEVDESVEFLFNVAMGTGITVMPELLRAEAMLLGLHAVPIAEPELRRTIVLAARSADVGARLYRQLAIKQLSAVKQLTRNEKRSRTAGSHGCDMHRPIPNPQRLREDIHLSVHQQLRGGA